MTVAGPDLIVNPKAALLRTPPRRPEEKARSPWASFVVSRRNSVYCEQSAGRVAHLGEGARQAVWAKGLALSTSREQIYAPGESSTPAPRATPSPLGRTNQIGVELERPA